MVKIISFETATDFLQAARADLERHEAVNNLVLGICGQLVDHPERFSSPPVLKTVEEDGNRFLTAIMTPPHNLIVSGSTVSPDGINLLVETLIRERTTIPGVIGPVDIARAIAVRWAEAARRRYTASQKLRMYELKEVLAPQPGRGKLRAAGAAELELVTRWWCEARMEMFGKSDAEEDRRAAQFRTEAGDVFLWEDDEPVSMACRTRPTRKGIGVGMVFTPPLMRNRGFATACVGELSRALLRSGWDFCTLYADLMNPVSNSIYQKIGYRPIGDFEEYEFTEKPPVL
jgi:uncharacterized protein